VRFLFITGNYKPAVNSGGPVNSVSSLAECLVRQGHSVTVLALNEDDGQSMDCPLDKPVRIEGVEVWYFQARAPLWRRVRARVSGIRRWEPAAFKWLTQHVPEFDVVHLQVGLLQPARAIAKLTRKHAKILCYHQRGNLDPQRFGRLSCLKGLYIRLIEVSVLRSASLLFALSQRERDVFQQWCPAAKVVRLPNGVEFERWRKNAEKTAPPADCSPSAGPVILWSARWDVRKGPLEFVEAAKILSRQLPDATFQMVGPATGEEVFRKVKAQVAAANVPRHYLYCDLPDPERKAIMHQANYFVLPTYGEGFSVGILEAMAAETVVITTPEANFPELEADQVGCIVSRSPSDIADKILALEADTKNRDQLARRASRYVKERYDWRRITNEYLAVIEKIIED